MALPVVCFLVSMPFKFCAKHLYATFPKCDVSKEDALARIVSTYNPEWAVVCHELHKDGDSHLHCAVRFVGQHQSRDAHFFDHVGDKHGNYQSPRSLKSVLKYIYKDGDLVTHGDVPTPNELTEGSSRVSPSKVVAKLLLGGATLKEIRDGDDTCGFYLTHQKHCSTLYSEVRAEALKKTLKPFPGISVDRSAPECEVRLNEWLDDNLQSDRKFKQKQLFLYGPPNIGKSSLAIQLSEYFMCYYPPMDEDYYDGYLPETCEIMIMDEFRSQKRITFLNQLLQGGPMTLRKKGSQILKTTNCPIVIFSNFPLEVCFPNAPQVALDALKARLEVIHWDSPTFIRLHLDGIEPSTPSYVEELDFSGAHSPDCVCARCTHD